ncbi:D-aminoacyl-tRNA deacylase [Halorubrum sp. AD140]|uniref:D-aminoacyl-tRNA deacylase n=1 Tax=Halorubrum sp. AD140 TaxID=3050073 RepID=UPI002ACCA872|nr:D-aminoacyl-tRNA deacylase [Halorubrum sp. AD140]MDZ5811119.1 D-aminoacyl-tRNA deacylase [Halorubrum sp. AD140]
MIAIVVSRADSASEHIGERLLAAGDWERREDGTRPDAAGGGVYYRTDGFELREFDDLHIDLDDPTAAFGEGDDDADPAFLVFVSRHSGETGRLLTAHVTGNFGPAPYGGEPGTLARAAPGAEKRVVEALAAHAPEGYDIGVECTHHGPTGVSVPSLFVELGSDEPQWTDAEAAEAVARAVLDLRGTGPDLVTDRGDVAVEPTGDAGDRSDDAGGGEPRHVVGFGGGHYAPRFTRIVRETAWAVGHVGADWALGEMGAPEPNRDVIEQAFARSRADHAVIEGDRPDLAATIEGLGHRVVSETWVREVGDRPLSLVERLETDLASVDDGLRFGYVSPADAAADAVRIRGLPSALLSRAQGIDADAAREAVDTNAVAFDTDQAGTRAAGDAAFAVDAETPDYDDLVDDLAAVLTERYDAVEVAEGAVVAREVAFDPALASDLGVPEGPAFGRLADGRAVEVDGETVAPADVSRTRTERFPIE